jgi:hypothetical protein
MIATFRKLQLNFSTTPMLKTWNLAAAWPEPGLSSWAGAFSIFDRTCSNCHIFDF